MLAPDNDRDILVSVDAITTDMPQTSNINKRPAANSSSLLESPIYAFIDSTVAEIWLPLSACKKFERAFQLQWDKTTQLYLVNDDLHSQLLTSNPNITLTIGAAPNTGSSIDITFPYAAFDLTAQVPYQGIPANSRYFPLRRASNDSQYTLGRVFLQEAYLTVDWERQNFSVSQINWQPNLSQHLVPILPQTSNGSATDGSSTAARLPPSVAAGIGVGTTVVIAIIVTLSYLLWRSHERQKVKAARKSLDDADSKDASKFSSIAAKPELDAGEDATRKVAEKDSGKSSSTHRYFFC
jgi:hypothetical protein